MSMKGFGTMKIARIAAVAAVGLVGVAGCSGGVPEDQVPATTVEQTVPTVDERVYSPEPTYKEFDYGLDESTLDSLFLQEARKSLDGSVIDVVTTDEELIELAHAACDALDAGLTGHELAAMISDVFGYGDDSVLMAQVLGIGVGTYCPEEVDYFDTQPGACRSCPECCEHSEAETPRD